MLPVFRRSFSSLPKKDRYDAIIVGGGHNGLIAAAYLAKSNKSVCVMERRNVVGGAAVTEEMIPDYKFSRCSYVLSLLRPQIYRDLELKRHGLEVYLRDPSSYTPLRKKYQTPGGPTSLTLGSDPKLNRKELEKFSATDAAQYEKYEETLSRFVEIIDPLLDTAPKDISNLMEASLLQKLNLLRQLKPLRKSVKAASKNDISALYELITGSACKILDQWFTSEPLKATLATDACIGAMNGPFTPGGGYVLLHHVMGELEGIRGAWGYPKGGMGAVSDAIAKSAVESGAEILTDAAVQQIITDNGRAKGVIMEQNSRVVQSDLVLSNASPKVTFLDLLDQSQMDQAFLRSVRAINYTSPVTKINVAVNKLPNFLADPNLKENVPMPHHQCTIHLNCENIQLIEDGYQDAARGGVSETPMIEMTIPSVLDQSISPEGHHICLFFTQYTPYHLKDGQEWSQETKEEYANKIFDTVELYAPGFKDSIVGKEVLSPPDLEKIFGLTGGNIFHGSMSLDQLFLTRPVASMKTMSPATPLENLYLCGSGAHPGGGVMGAAGRMAAKEALLQANVKWSWD